MLNNTTLAFIGSGAMAEAMIKGILNKGLTAPRRIIASGPRPERGQELKERYGACIPTGRLYNSCIFIYQAFIFSSFDH